MNWIERFIERLRELARTDDRAALASLRRSLDGENASFAGAARVIANVLPRSLNRWEEDDAYLVAALFALSPSERGVPLAAALRQVMTSSGSTSIELRFTALLASNREDLPTHLRHAVTLTRSAGIELDWRRLFEDVRSWGHPNSITQKQWARQFWGLSEQTADTSTTPEGTAS